MAETDGAGPAQEPETLVEVLDPTTKQALTTYDPFVKEIGELKKTIGDTVYDLTKTKDNKEARRVRAALKAIPGKLDDAYNAWNQPYLNTARKLREIRDTLKGEASAIVKPLDDQITEDERRREVERVEAERLASERKTEISRRITGIMAIPVNLAAESSAKLGETIAWLEQQQITEEKFGERKAEAEEIVKNVLVSLATLKTGALAREQQQRDLEEQRRRNEELEAEAARQRELEAQRRLEESERARVADEERRAQEKKQQDAFEGQRIVAERGAAMRNEVFNVMDKDSNAIFESIQRVRNMPTTDIPADVDNNLPAVQAEVLKKLQKLHADVLDEETRKLNALREEIVAVGRSALQVAEGESSVEDVKREITRISLLDDSKAKFGQLESLMLKAKVDALQMLQAHLKQLELDAAAAEMPKTEDEAAQEGAPVAEEAANDVDLPAEDLTPPGDDAESALAEANQEARSSYEEDSAPVYTPLPVQRPSDQTILHLLATTYGVTEADALGWLEELDLYELRQHVKGAA